MIYFVQAFPSRAIKIGFTHRNLDQRITEIQKNSPDDLLVLGCMYGSRNDEKALHERFRQWHLRDEWFQDADEIHEYIKQNAIDLFAEIFSQVTDTSAEDVRKVLLLTNELLRKRGN